MDPDKVFPHGSTIVIAAFGGWNDAGQSATDALEHLLDVWHCEEIIDLPGDEYYDYQFNRPEVSLGLAGDREIAWPGTTVFKATADSLPDTKIFLVHGVEPSMKWKQFCAEIMSQLQLDKDTVLVTLGALLADVAHTRPIPVSGTTSSKQMQLLTGFESSKYEGPTGILGILQSEFEVQGIPSIALWAAIPHYVATPPCPKATLSLIRGLEDLLDTSIPVDLLIEEARAWQLGVDEMSTEDDEISDYVRGLEETQDTAELPEATGEAIAREFERYLRRREN
ncbi:MAG: PAC2 family protein [Candidatus Nanopelagicales bacterium]|nr:PAC2 family protein [Candidatus Nanopelagicales bacterium]